MELMVLTVPPTASVGELTLRPWRDEDIDALIEAYQDPLLREWTGLPVTDRPEARRWLDHQRHGWQTAERLSFAVEEESAVTGESLLLANVALKLVLLANRPPTSDSGEFGCRDHESSEVCGGSQQRQNG